MIHLCDQAHPVGDDDRLALGAAHAAQPRGHEQPAGQVLVGRDAELGAARV